MANIAHVRLLHELERMCEGSRATQWHDCRYVLHARAAAERGAQQAERRGRAGARRAGAALEAEAGGGNGGPLGSAFEAGDAGDAANGDYDDDMGGAC